MSDATKPHTFIPKGTIPMPASCRVCGLSGFDEIHDDMDDNERLAAIRELLNQASYQQNGETQPKFHRFTVDLLRLARGFEEDNL